jgi:hypothetical protein
VRGESQLHPIGVGLPPTRRTLHVGDQKSHHPRRRHRPISGHPRRMPQKDARPGTSLRYAPDEQADASTPPSTKGTTRCQSCTQADTSPRVSSLRARPAFITRTANRCLCGASSAPSIIARLEFHSPVAPLSQLPRRTRHHPANSRGPVPTVDHAAQALSYLADITNTARLCVSKKMSWWAVPFAVSRLEAVRRAARRSSRQTRADRQPHHRGRPSVG